MNNEKITFAQFADGYKIDRNALDAATVYRAIELDVGLGCEMLHSIADLIEAVRTGADAKRLAELAGSIASEYECLTHVEEFATDPVRELMAIAARDELDAMPTDGMARA